METLSSSSIPIFTRPNLLQPGGDSHGRFRLMLVHDGLQRIEGNIGDLRERGFPDDSEVLLLSVSDLFRTSLHLAGKDPVPPVPLGASPRRGLAKHKKTQAFFDHLEFVRRQAHTRLQGAFPQWDIRFERPLAWQPSLIYLCVSEPSAVIDFGVGEILRKLSLASNIPLIVARRSLQSSRTARRFSLVVFNDPASAGAVLEELRRRPLERAAEIYLLFYRDVLTSTAECWSASNDDPDRQQHDRLLIETRSAIEALGYKVSCLNVVGNTAHAILQEAGRIDAGSILLGLSRGFSTMHTVAATVAAQARCTVAIVFAAREPCPVNNAISSPKHAARASGSGESRAGLSSAL